MNDLIYFANTNPSSYQMQANIFVKSAANFLNPLAYFIINNKNINDTYPDNYNTTGWFARDIINNYRSSNLDIYTGDGY